MSWLANCVYLLAAVGYLPIVAYRMVVQKKNRRGWWQRFGHLDFAPPKGRRIWVHAVSLGETNAARLIVEQLSERLPDAEILISSTTDTGFARACRLYGPERVFRYPLDLSWMVRRALERIQPSMIVLMELEVWPNLMTLARSRDVPVVVVNGRLTERSFRRLHRFSFAGQRAFRNLRWVGAQDATIAARFRNLGVTADRIDVTGSVKWDTVTLGSTVDGATDLQRAMGIDAGKPLWICGSTGPGEEALILDAYSKSRTTRPDLQLAIIPRKPERFDEVAHLIERGGYTCRRRSRQPDGSQIPGSSVEGRSWIALGDTMGELRKFYALADAVFVGRSLIPMGGSDPMEVAALGRPM
ncbi:MAG: 3-deoxy-D-manno-octulosonic acid transferase, partial [Planctomycetes bacterium]|nr:3-deoxy-D-manno-octulosonic acid transferase [Planctomycetota bacterium]